MKNSNARVNFSFYSDDYPDIELTFNCNKDLSLDELVEYFKRFAVVMGYGLSSIEGILGKD